MPVIKKTKNYIFTTDGCFSLSRTLDCGQCFRFEEVYENCWQGVARGQFVRILQEGDTLVFFDTSEEQFNDVWRDYFDIDRDYVAADRLLCCDERLKSASNCARGIHILKQEPWEALCSFIISQNNNISRIKGIVARLCENFGTPLDFENYTFPSAKRVAELTADDLSPLRAGFRTKYIMDAAFKVACGEVNLERIANLPLAEAQSELMKINGVGQKVADCTLLYGFGRIEAFPVDVWIKRIMGALFKEGLPDEFKPIGGIAQQYLFHYIRNSADLILK